MNGLQITNSETFSRSSTQDLHLSSFVLWLRTREATDQKKLKQKRSWITTTRSEAVVQGKHVRPSRAWALMKFNRLCSIRKPPNPCPPPPAHIHAGDSVCLGKPRLLVPRNLLWPRNLFPPIIRSLPSLITFNSARFKVPSPATPAGAAANSYTPLP
jgi:hypothetical protein